MTDLKFRLMTSYAAIAGGIFAILYAYFFVIAKDTKMYSLFLLLLGLATLELVIGLYPRLKKAHEDFARVVVVLGVIGAAGMAIHGGYDLANALNPPAGLNMDLPNQVDPRGLLTFGFLGLAVVKISYLLSKDNKFEKGLIYLGYVSGALLVLIYLARLTVLSPA